MSPADIGLYYAESAKTPLHVGSVAVFEGPAPSYGDVVRLLLGKLDLVPRYRQRVRPVPLQLGRPVWMDDPHFQILYHVRHTAVPSPGGAEQLRNLAGRILGQRLDLTKPLWELWLVEGLADDRWAIISKVHQCMVDGAAGTDLMRLVFELTPDAPPAEPPDWIPRRGPSTLQVLGDAVQDSVAHPLRQLNHLPWVGTAVRAAKEAFDSGGRSLTAAVPAMAEQRATPTARALSGPTGPHRRWAWTQAELADLRSVAAALGGTVDDVALAAVGRGFGDLLDRRGLLGEQSVVPAMVPIASRDEHGHPDDHVRPAFLDLPVAEPDPAARLASIRRQRLQQEGTTRPADEPPVAGMGDFMAPTLLSLGVRAALAAGQASARAVITSVPGPRVPLHVLGRRMRSAHAYVPLAGGIGVAIGTFSYLDTMTFGINADFDGFPDLDVLAEGIGRGVAELVDAARQVANRPSPDGTEAGSSPAAR